MIERCSLCGHPRRECTCRPDDVYGPEPVAASEPTRGAEGRYRKKPVVIDALRWNGENLAAIQDWGCPATILPATDKQSLIIGTLEDGPNHEAVHVATMGDWIIKGVKGEYYPVKPDIFDVTYEPEAASPAAQARLTRALETLTKRLRFIHSDSRYQSVWTFATIHGMPYKGPQYDKELEAAEAALDAAKEKQP